MDITTDYMNAVHILWCLFFKCTILCRTNNQSNVTLYETLLTPTANELLMATGVVVMTSCVLLLCEVVGIACLDLRSNAETDVIFASFLDEMSWNKLGLG